jgi:glucosamine-6-phosphate deaminase
MPAPTTEETGGATVSVFADTTIMAAAAAAVAGEVIRDAVERNGVAHAMFATGNSQLAFVDTLVNHTDDVPWADVVVFHMDEYVGLGPDHPASFQRWIRERIVEPAHPRAAHYFDGLAPPDEECDRYAALLVGHPLDLCCLGIGENGHLAFNDPPVADFADPLDVKIVELDPGCRRQQVNEGHFPADDDVPRLATTVTIPALLRAARVLAVVPESRKAPAVRAALEGGVTTACPASLLQRTPHASVFLDADAASLLQRP